MQEEKARVSVWSYCCQSQSSVFHQTSTQKCGEAAKITIGALSAGLTLIWGLTGRDAEPLYVTWLASLQNKSSDHIAFS